MLSNRRQSLIYRWFPRHGFKGFFGSLACGALIIAITLIWAVLPTSDFPISAPFFVNKGDSITKATDNLKTAGFIRSTFLFSIYTRLIASEKGVIAGTYVFYKPTNMFDIAQKITQKNGGATNIKVTIPEGSTNEQIAVILKKNVADFNTEEFLAKSTTSQGYLFPDTYYISQYSTVDDILEIFDSNFKKKVVPIYTEIAASGKSLTDILSMAAIVEKEANSDESRKMIADILWRRLEEGMPLQVDVATSTYKAKGLTERPITNPGLKSINAVLHPTPNKFVFYISDYAGLFHYAMTFDEHRANIAKYLK